MGGPKAGKSIGLMNFAVNGVLAGKNVLFVTLEVSKAIQADRMDSFISGVRMKDLAANAVAVKSAVKAKTPKAGGSLKVHEFPNASFRVSDLRRLVRRYEAQGVKFDLVVVDYADIMRPEDDKLRGEIEGYKQIYMGLRGLAQEEGFAVLSATQTNRGGAKAQTAGKTDVAEDFNKIRLADIVLSINRDDTDKDAGRMRLHFAAHRNGEEGHSLMCNTDLSKMRLIEDITGIAA
jgi:replicative DNA helicase